MRRGGESTQPGMRSAVSPGSPRLPSTRYQWTELLACPFHSPGILRYCATPPPPAPRCCGCRCCGGSRYGRRRLTTDPYNAGKLALTRIANCAICHCERCLRSNLSIGSCQHDCIGIHDALSFESLLRCLVRLGLTMLLAMTNRKIFSGKGAKPPCNPPNVRNQKIRIQKPESSAGETVRRHHHPHPEVVEADVAVVHVTGGGVNFFCLPIPRSATKIRTAI